MPLILGILASSILSKVDLALGHSTSPYLTTYPWNDGIGFGTKYSDAATLMPGDCYHTRFSSSNKYLIAATGSSPYVGAYNWTAGSGFGTKFSDPATIPGGTVGRGANFSWDETAAFVASTGASPWIYAYAWSSSGFGAKYADPATTPGGNSYMGEWSRNNAYLFISSTTATSSLQGYAWSSGFGTKLANPTTAGDTGFGLSVNQPDDTIFVSTATTVSPFVHAYNWTGTAFGAKYADPASVGTGGSVDNHSRGSTSDAVSFAMLGGAYQVVYPWSAGFGSKYANPASAVSAAARATGFTPSGNDIMFGIGASPWVEAYAWSSGFGTKYSAPATTPTGVVRGGHFNN